MRWRKVRIVTRGIRIFSELRKKVIVHQNANLRLRLEIFKKSLINNWSYNNKILYLRANHPTHNTTEALLTGCITPFLLLLNRMIHIAHAPTPFTRKRNPICALIALPAMPLPPIVTLATDRTVIRAVILHPRLPTPRIVKAAIGPLWSHPQTKRKEFLRQCHFVFY